MRVAVIGTGIAGNAAAWTLSKRYPVTVYDRELRPGGHSHTVTIDYDGVPVAVDIGFIVYNELNYPDLTALFAHLGVETVESCMSFAVTADQGRFEWKGGGADWIQTAIGLFAQPKNLLSPSYLWMLRDILTFNQQSVADHAERDGSSLRLYAQRRAAEHGFQLGGGRVKLLCYPRLLGYTFNPLSVYFCYRADGELALIIYEVRNTFGDIHAYVIPVKPDELSEAGLRQQQEKLFYVSPFIEMAMRYHFRVSPPGERVKLRILETDREGPLLAATFNGRRRNLTTAALLRAFVTLPLVTLKIVAAIHWEALRLWLKGARVVPRPVPRLASNPHAAAANAVNIILASGQPNDYTISALPAASSREGALVQ
jgi:DUF1365 family protein